MKYVVMDLEFNHPRRRALISVNNGIELDSEIIEIGAVRLNESLEQEDEYCAYIRPAAYKTINDEVKEVTGITNEMMWSGRDFPTVVNEFLAWCGDDYAFVTWSDNDIFTLEDNMLYHEMDIDGLPECYDIQPMFDDQISQNERSMALNYAIWKLGIKVSGDHLHDALCDAKETAEVMKRLDLSEGLEDYIIE
ncbi:MAG: exonuclease domain-containing protein [Eubacterium sp.]|nr:exonuclease domain-containing protein [Eubacterium sp.]